MTIWTGLGKKPELKNHMHDDTSKSYYGGGIYAQKQFIEDAKGQRKALKYLRDLAKTRTARFTEKTKRRANYKEVLKVDITHEDDILY